MGQTIGRAPLLAPPRHFVNLPKTRVYELWQAFDGYSVVVKAPNPDVARHRH